MKNRIKELRKSKGLSQEQLGKLVNTTKQTISQLEKGKYALTQDWMEKIAKALGVQPFQILPNSPYPQWGSPVGAGLGDSGYKGARKAVFEMLDMWDQLSPEQQKEFLAIALIHQKSDSVDLGGLANGNQDKIKNGGRK